MSSLNDGYTIKVGEYLDNTPMMWEGTRREWIITQSDLSVSNNISIVHRRCNTVAINASGSMWMGNLHEDYFTFGEIFEVFEEIFSDALLDTTPFKPVVNTGGII